MSRLGISSPDEFLVLKVLIRLMLSQNRCTGTLRGDVIGLHVLVCIDPGCQCARMQHYSGLQDRITNVRRDLLRLRGRIGQTFVNVSC